MTLPRVGITLGDPGGIGPEVVLKAFSGRFALPKADYILYGSHRLIKQEEKDLGLSLSLDSGGPKASRRPALAFREVASPLRAIKKGAPSRANGLASFRYFERAVDDARRGKLRAIVTAPISKTSWALAGVRWRGHTEYLSCFYPDAIMMFWSEKLKVALLTHHLSLGQALKKVRRKNLLSFFLKLHQGLKQIRPERFEYLVAGLNPHGGEEGLLGREEIDEIIPAIEEAQKLGLKISGPWAPDVIFRSALGMREKIVIALYHDQGLIPFKLEAFDAGVNLSLGLPFVRTSPDHGTAYDIAGKNIASPQSLIAAIRLAVRLSTRRP